MIQVHLQVQLSCEWLDRLWLWAQLIDQFIHSTEVAHLYPQFVFPMLHGFAKPLSILCSAPAWKRREAHGSRDLLRWARVSTPDGRRHGRQWRSRAHLGDALCRHGKHLEDALPHTNMCSFVPASTPHPCSSALQSPRPSSSTDLAATRPTAECSSPTSPWWGSAPPP
jgi:hypothetical protein